MRFRISHVFHLLSIGPGYLICICMAAIFCSALGGTGWVDALDEQDDDGSITDVLSSMIQIPSGDTNALYYAGSSGKKAIMIHITSTGERKWKMQKANLDQDVIMAYTEDRDKWILLKGTGGDRLLHWNWKQEIKDFIQRLPRKSAIVSPVSSWYQVDSNTSNVLWVIDSFVVDATLCETLKYGDKICTVRLFDGQIEERRRILSEAHGKKVKIMSGQIVSRKLKYACWDSAKIVHIGGSLTETALCVDSEIIAPLKFQWNCLYDELLPFEEIIAISAYKKRAEEVKGNKR